MPLKPVKVTITVEQAKAVNQASGGNDHVDRRDTILL